MFFMAGKIPLEFGGLGANLVHGHPNSGIQHWGYGIN